MRKFNALYIKSQGRCAPPPPPAPAPGLRSAYLVSDNTDILKLIKRKITLFLYCWCTVYN